MGEYFSILVVGGREFVGIAQSLCRWNGYVNVLVGQSIRELGGREIFRRFYERF